jgi:hypothetical protein
MEECGSEPKSFGFEHVRVYNIAVSVYAKRLLEFVLNVGRQPVLVLGRFRSVQVQSFLL